MKREIDRMIWLFTILAIALVREKIDAQVANYTGV